MNNFELITGKIVGAANNLEWSQTHVFFPEDKEKKANFGNLFACFSLKAKREEVDTTSFGKEIVNRFHEIYYSSLENQVLERLKLSLQSLTTEFNDQVELGVTAGVVIEKEEKLIGYFAVVHQGKVFILRNGLLVEILSGQKEAVKSCSGWLQDNDLVALGTAQFFSIVSLGSLKAALESLKPSLAIESLAPLVHARTENSESAAIIFKPENQVPKTAVETEQAIETQPTVLPETLVKPEVNIEPTKIILEKKAKSQLIPKFFSTIKNSPSVAKRLFRELKNQPNIFIRDKEKRNRAKKTTLTVAFVLIVLLIVSVVFGSKHRSILKESTTSQNLFKEIEYQYDQAVSLEELNPLRSRSLLTEAKDKIREAEPEIKLKSDQEKLQELLAKIEAELEKVAKEYRIENANLFLDLKLVKDGFKGTSWGFSNDYLQVLDPKLSTILEVNVVNKATKIAAGGEQLNGVNKVGADEGTIFGVKTDELLAIDQKRGEVAARRKAEDWGKIQDLFGFGGSAYLLDTSKGRIIKYQRSESSFADPKDYLKTDLDLTDAQDMAIDGSVWVLFSDGTIVKFTRGIKDNFIVAGLNTQFKEPEKIYTDSNLDNLYILDRKNLRVVVLGKETGEYQAQYSWPGIAGAEDIFVSEKEGKILLLTGERIYEIALKG